MGVATFLAEEDLDAGSPSAHVDRDAIHAGRIGTELEGDELHELRGVEGAAIAEELDGRFARLRARPRRDRDDDREGQRGGRGLQSRDHSFTRARWRPSGKRAS